MIFSLYGGIVALIRVIKIIYLAVVVVVVVVVIFTIIVLALIIFSRCCRWCVRNRRKREVLLSFSCIDYTLNKWRLLFIIWRRPTRVHRHHRNSFLSKLLGFFLSHCFAHWLDEAVLHHLSILCLLLNLFGVRLFQRVGTSCSATHFTIRGENVVKFGEEVAGVSDYSWFLIVNELAKDLMYFVLFVLEVLVDYL